MKLALLLIIVTALTVHPAAAQRTGERVSALEEWQKQQQDYIDKLDEHMTHHIDDMVREQGVQNEKIATLESRINVIYSIGDAGIWAIGILLALFLFYNKRKYSESRERQQVQHKENQDAMTKLGDRIEEIETTLNIPRKHANPVN